MQRAPRLWGRRSRGGGAGRGWRGEAQLPGGASWLLFLPWPLHRPPLTEALPRTCPEGASRAGSEPPAVPLSGPAGQAARRQRGRPGPGLNCRARGPPGPAAGRVCPQRSASRCPQRLRGRGPSPLSPAFSGAQLGPRRAGAAAVPGRPGVCPAPASQRPGLCPRPAWPLTTAPRPAGASSSWSTGPTTSTTLP